MNPEIPNFHPQYTEPALPENTRPPEEEETMPSRREMLKATGTIIAADAIERTSGANLVRRITHGLKEQSIETRAEDRADVSFEKEIFNDITDLLHKHNEVSLNPAAKAWPEFTQAILEGVAIARKSEDAAVKIESLIQKGAKNGLIGSAATIAVTSKTSINRRNFFGIMGGLIGAGMAAGTEQVAAPQGNSEQEGSDDSASSMPIIKSVANQSAYFLLANFSRSSPALKNAWHSTLAFMDKTPDTLPWLTRFGMAYYQRSRADLEQMTHYENSPQATQ